MAKFGLFIKGCDAYTGSAKLMPCCAHARSFREWRLFWLLYQRHRRACEYLCWLVRAVAGC